MSLTSLSPAPASNMYAVFSGEINQDSTRRFFKAVSTATAKNVRHLHVLVESYGGFVGDGICLYNFFKSLPVDFPLFNLFAVQSISPGVKSQIDRQRFAKIVEIRRTHDS